MKYLRRFFKQALCKHPKRKLTRIDPDMVMVEKVCEGCGKSFSEVYNGFKALRQYERK